MLFVAAQAQQPPGLSFQQQGELLTFIKENVDQESYKKILYCHKEASFAPTPSRYLQGLMSCIIHEAAEANYKREQAELALRAAQAPAVKQLVASLESTMNRQGPRGLQGAFDAWLAANDLPRYPVVKAYLAASSPLFGYQAALQALSKKVFAGKEEFCLAFGLPKPNTCTKSCQPTGPAGSIDYQCLREEQWKEYWVSEAGALQMCAPLAPKLHIPQREPATKGLFTSRGDLNARFYCPREKKQEPPKENEFLKTLWQRLEKNPSVDSADSLWAAALTRGAKHGPWGWADNVRLDILLRQLHDFRLELGTDSEKYLLRTPAACQASPTLAAAWRLSPTSEVQDAMKERTESLSSDFYLEELHKYALKLRETIAKRKNIAEQETVYELWKQANLLRLDVEIARLQAQISFAEDPLKALRSLQNKEGTFRSKRMELEKPLRHAQAQKATLPSLEQSIRALEKQILAHREQTEEIRNPCNLLKELDEKRANAVQESVLLDEKGKDLQDFIDKIWEENSHWKSAWVDKYRRMDEFQRKQHVEEVRTRMAQALKKQHEVKKTLTSEEQKALLRELDRELLVAFQLNRILFGDYYAEEYLPEALTKAEPHFLTEFAAEVSQTELAFDDNIAELEAKRDALVPKKDEFWMPEEMQPLPIQPKRTTSFLTQPVTKSRNTTRADSLLPHDITTRKDEQSSLLTGTGTLANSKELALKEINLRLQIMRSLKEGLVVHKRAIKLREVMKRALVALGYRWSAEIGELCVLGDKSLDVLEIANKLYNNQKIGSTYTIRHLLSYETQLYERDRKFGLGGQIKTALLSHLPEYLPMHQCMEQQLNARGDQHQGPSKALGGEVPGSQHENFEITDMTKGVANACVSGLGCPAVIWLDGETNERRAQSLVQLCNIPGSLCSKREVQELLAAKDAAGFKKWFGIIFGALEVLFLAL